MRLISRITRKPSGLLLNYITEIIIRPVIGRFTYGEAGDKGDMIVDPDTNAFGRYLKVSVEASNHANGCSSIAEIYVFDVNK